MKTLIWADLHGHNFKEFSTQELGMNTRLRDQLDVISKITLSAIEYQIDCILFLGDLYHLKNNLDSQVIKTILNHITVLADEVKEFVVIPGNHDYRMWSSEPLLLEFLQDYHKRVVVIQEPKWISYGGDKFFAAPFTRRVKELNDMIANLDTADPSGSVFLGHQDIIGVNYGGFVVELGLNPDMLSKKFRWSFTGHFHNVLNVRENVISVGAPLQHNFSDVGERRGWWIYETNMDPIFIENTFSPKFQDFECSDDATEAPGQHDRDFYRVKIKGITPPAAVKKLKWKRVSYEVSSERKERSVLKFSDSREDIITKYVDARAGELDKKKLIELGRNYL